ncbi:MAG: VCBS repeat-containing protein [Bacteroidota bacterium]
MKPILFSCLLAATALPAADPDDSIEFSWSEKEIDEISIGYGLQLTDINGDGELDILLADKSTVQWYENPTWDKHIIAEKLTVRDNVCIAARDIDGDGKAEIAVGGQWNFLETMKDGAVHWINQASGNRRTQDALIGIKPQATVVFTTIRPEGNGFIGRCKQMCTRSDTKALILVIGEEKISCLAAQFAFLHKTLSTIYRLCQIVVGQSIGRISPAIIPAQRKGSVATYRQAGKILLRQGLLVLVRNLWNGPTFALIRRTSQINIIGITQHAVQAPTRPTDIYIAIVRAAGLVHCDLGRRMKA